uniref:LINE-1 type transposase domain-containing protein 1 n=1 Tax=Leptobrachium leishanense TaxID=445787 RepID=A0A8C5WGA6_9ANUR
MPGPSKSAKTKDAAVAPLFTPRRTTASQDGGRPKSRPTSAGGSGDEDGGESDAGVSRADAVTIMSQMAEMRTFLAGEMDRNTKALQADILALGQRTSDLEDRTDELSGAYNSLIDHSNAMSHKVDYLETQLEDLTNRSRRNNLRIRGLPERAEDDPLGDFIVAMLRPLAPELPDHAWELDRAHRALRARSATDERPRDIIIRFLHFSTKELILKKKRTKPILYDGSPLQLFQDISPDTLRRRRSWKPVADLLRSHNIAFAWGHPFKILAFRNKRTYVLLPHSDPMKFFRALDVQPPEDFASP